MKHSILRVTASLTIVIVILTSIAVSLPYYRFSQELLLERALDQLTDQGRAVTMQVSLAVEDAIHETLFLSGNDAVLNVLSHKQGATENRQALERFLLKHKTLGRIDLYPYTWPEGKAIIVHRNGERIGSDTETRGQLQQRTPTYSGDMIHKAMALPPGEVVLSEVAANGLMHRPYFVQIGTAVRDGKNTPGAVVVHLDLGSVLSRQVEAETYTDARIYMTNASGQTLYLRQSGNGITGPGQDTIPEWLMSQKSTADIPISQLSKEQIGGDEYAVYQHAINYTKNSGDFLNLYLLVPYQQITGKAQHLHIQTLAMSLASVLLAVLVLVLYSRRITRPMQQIMSALSAFRKGEVVTALPVERSDELGELGRSIDEMVREVRERTSQLEESRGKLEALFEVVQEGIVITDQDGYIESVNPSLCSMFGYDEQELLGQSNAVLMPEPYSSHHDKYMRDSIRTGTLGFMGMYRDLTAIRKDGTIFPVVINVETLKMDDVQLFAAVIRDVTKQKEYERDLLNAKMRAEVANEAKSNFLSMMSHEIRTPLNGVMGVLQILESEISAPEQKEFLDVASRSASNLLHIVNDILDISKAESGAMELEEQEFNLRDLLEESVELYLAKLADTDIGLRFFMPLDMPTCIIGDPFRLQQMINNLLSNAIKFTDQGEVGLSISWEPRDETGINIRIDISDTGVGIAKDKQKTIFEPFIQADTSTSRSYGGTGLGLSIVKRITTLMGGRVWVASEPGVGSTFHLYLPFRVAAFENGETSHRLQGIKVLYVGIQADDTMLLEYLNYHKAIVDIVGLDELKQSGLTDDTDYDVVILECRDKDAIGILNRLAEDNTAQGMKFICLRQHIESHHPELHQAILTLHEPVLNRTLDSLFGYMEQSPISTPQPQSTTLEGTKMPRILLVEDNPVNQMVAKSMVTKMGYEVVIANNGQEALDTIKAEDIDLVLMDCHMPVMDGFEATEQIRNHLAGRPLPIIAMTADASVSDRDRCISAGMDDHLPKPIKIDILKSAIEGWLKR